MKKWNTPVQQTGKVLITVGILFLASCMAYLILVKYYGSSFLPNVWINGVYCTGKTVEEVNSELLLTAEAPSVVITDKDGREWKLTGDEISYAMDFSGELKDCLKEQKPYLWFRSLGEVMHYTMSPAVTYDEAQLKAFWDALPCVVEEQEAAEVAIVSIGESYELKNLTLDRLDSEKGYALLKQALEQGRENLDLEKEGVYRDLPITDEQQSVMDQWEKVKNFLETELIYDMGDEKITLDMTNKGQFLVRSEDGTFQEEEDGSLSISKEMTDQFIDALADEYDTYGKEREFLSTRGDVITLSKGIYGTLIDRKAEKAYLYEALSENSSEVHIPSYKRKAYHRGKNDIGDTYIEIDMTNQKMYLYKDGECLVETDVVTGRVSRGWDTPEGINYVYAKQKNRILRGPGYASPVKYWMPVNGNIGIHDASWRSSFGGEIYKKNGSHGCINTPYDAMKVIYETVEIGVPVIMFN